MMGQLVDLPGNPAEGKYSVPARREWNSFVGAGEVLTPTDPSTRRRGAGNKPPYLSASLRQSITKFPRTAIRMTVSAGQAAALNEPWSL